MRAAPTLRLDEPPLASRFCRTCVWWKRRASDIGTCWQPDQCGVTVDQHDTCLHHAPKVFHVTPEER